MTDQIQKLAEELKEKFDTVFSDISDYEFEHIAKHVIERELEAELRGFQYCNESYIYGRNTFDRIEELTNQLQQLRGGK